MYHLLSPVYKRRKRWNRVKFTTTGFMNLHFRPEHDLIGFGKCMSVYLRFFCICVTQILRPLNLKTVITSLPQAIIS